MWKLLIGLIFLTLVTAGGNSAAGIRETETPEKPLNFPREITGNEANFYGANLNGEIQMRGLRMPCECVDGECGCCTGNILQNFNINMRQHLCLNMTYEPEDLSIGVRMSINDLVLLSRKVSGRNPPPFCVSIPRIGSIKFCGKLTNVYFIRQNIHACITLETEWNERTVFSFSFDCVRLGMDGVAILPAEAGGGLPHPTEQGEDNIEEYDELLENQTTKKPTKKPTRKTTTTRRPPADGTTTVKTRITTRKTTTTTTTTSVSATSGTSVPVSVRTTTISSPEPEVTFTFPHKIVKANVTTPKTILLYSTTPKKILTIEGATFSGTETTSAVPEISNSMQTTEKAAKLKIKKKTTTPPK